MKKFFQDELNKKAFRYSLAIFILIMFLWWFVTGGGILEKVEQPPAGKLTALISEAFETGLETILYFLGLKQ